MLSYAYHCSVLEVSPVSDIRNVRHVVITGFRKLMKYCRLLA